MTLLLLSGSHGIRKADRRFKSSRSEASDALAAQFCSSLILCGRRCPLAPSLRASWMQSTGQRSRPPCQDRHAAPWLSPGRSQGIDPRRSRSPSARMPNLLASGSSGAPRRRQRGCCTPVDGRRVHARANEAQRPVGREDRPLRAHDRRRGFRSTQLIARISRVGQPRSR